MLLFQRFEHLGIKIQHLFRISVFEIRISQSLAVFLHGQLEPYEADTVGGGFIS